MKNLMFISFIIPALNEEKHIARTISAIHDAMKNAEYEIIVCDNGSTDNTAIIAKGLGAQLILEPNKNIGGLRNSGALNSKGDIIAFIDADVSIAKNWLEVLVSKYSQWPANKYIITGSACLVPSSANFIEKNWFSKLKKAKASYINSGHMIITREVFQFTNGFDESLRTGEDYEYCNRAREKGVVIASDNDLKAYHYGYPSTWVTFMNREAWHGKEDFSTFKNFINSKTAIAATLNMLLLVTGTFFILSENEKLIAIPIYATSLALCFLLAFVKFGYESFTGNLKTSICFEAYLIGRMGALFFSRSRPKARS